MSASGGSGDEPVRLLSVEGLNYLTTALLYMTAQRMGPEFMAEVLEMAEHLRADREVRIAYTSDRRIVDTRDE